MSRNYTSRRQENEYLKKLTDENNQPYIKGIMMTGKLWNDTLENGKVDVIFFVLENVML